MIRQHEAIAAANVPSVFESLPGWDQHQADLNAVLALQGISPGQNAHDAAIARSTPAVDENVMGCKLIISE